MGRNSKANRDKKIKNKAMLNSKKLASENKRLYSIPDIFFDESGNTGGNLIDENQLVFALGSCRIDRNDALKALALAGSQSPDEVHFKTLKRRRSGQDAIIRVLESDYIKKSDIKAYLIDKKYMIATKIVDLLIETWSSKRGVDIYIGRNNIFMSKVIYSLLPEFCDAEKVNKMYSCFVKMISDGDEVSIANFYSSVDEISHSMNEIPHSADEEKAHEIIKIISLTRCDINNILESIDKSCLDPAVPALFCHTVEWGKMYPNGYHIKHDDSKPIAKSKDVFVKLMDKKNESEIIGYDTRVFELPIKAKSLSFHSSEEYPQLQIADIIASAVAHYQNCIIKNNTDDYLFKELKRIKIDRFFKNMTILPSDNLVMVEQSTFCAINGSAPDRVAEFMK